MRNLVVVIRVFGRGIRWPQRGKGEMVMSFGGVYGHTNFHIGVKIISDMDTEIAYTSCEPLNLRRKLKALRYSIALVSSLGIWTPENILRTILVKALHGIQIKDTN